MSARDQLLKYFVRRPPPSEVEMLRKWIAAGAPKGDVQPDVASEAPDPLVSDQDRKHWAFQPPTRESSSRSIDSFLESKLKPHGLTFSPEAGRDALIRRAHVDLTGLPPSVEAWRRWRDDPGSDWHARMVDELLASPRYGERWGRYWLDVAGYADSEGGVSADPLRTVAWKYRDYVIRAFNEDKPYDRFLIEQLAGDELQDFRSGEVTEEVVQNLTATGFLRMGIDQTGSRTMNFVPERLGVIGDAISVLGSGVMGLTLECARCHSHKYDAIPQRDYYRLKAVFQGALDEHDWLTFKNRSLTIDVPERRARVAKTNPPLQKKIKRLETRRKLQQAELQLRLLEAHYPDQPDSDRQETIRALKIADNNRTLPQRVLVEMLQRAQVIPDSQQPASVLEAQSAIESTQDEIEQIRGRMEPPLAIRALWDRGEPSPTYLLRRGEHSKPGPLVGPGVPSVLTDGRTPFEVAPPNSHSTGRRLALARWLTSREHPLTARVMVNRIWRHHFGAGLVRSLENFGVKGERPSHPELLDWLAVEFMEQGWSIKHMHRVMMNSRAYKQSSRISKRRFEQDPQNRLLSRMPLRRMDAEALRDSLLFVSGRLDVTAGGPPDPIRVDREGLVSGKPLPSRTWRRSVYLQYRRTEIPTMLATFDYPEMGPNCIARSESVVSPQSLMLTNNRRVREWSAALASRVSKQLSEPAGDGEAVSLVYQLALSRMPSQAEKQLGIETLKQLRADWNGQSIPALETYCHAILNSASFLYVD